MKNHHHALFQHFPLKGVTQLTTGEVPTPYHIYDGYGAFIGGIANLDAMRHLLKGEQVTPVQTTDGHALMGIWICNFTEASLGPHHELQISVFVSPKQIIDIPPHPLSVLTIMLTRPDVLMLCHGLWNNTPTVVAYNRELLSLNARLSESQIDRDAQQLTFSVKDKLTNTPILSGTASKPGQASVRATMALAARLGFGTTLRLRQQPWTSMRVVNPLGVVLNHNAIAEAHNKNDVNNVRFFESPADTVTCEIDTYSKLGFTPQFVQHMSGFKFVYLNPQFGPTA